MGSSTPREEFLNKFPSDFFNAAGSVSISRFRGFEIIAYGRMECPSGWDASLWSLCHNVAIGSFQSVRGGGGGSLWAVSKVESWMRAPHLPKFILLVNFSDTICGFDFRHFWLSFVAAFAVLKGLLLVPVGTMGPL